MRKIINKISKVLEVILMAPVKLPGKALNIIKYVALAFGLIETVIGKEDEDVSAVDPESPKSEAEVNSEGEEVSNENQ